MSEVIDYSEWKKLDIRVGEVKEPRQLVAGLKGYYNPDDLVGRKVVVFVNLKPVKLRGIESQGMVLAAVDETTDTVSLLTIDQDAPIGARIE
jgi:methionyl-tRNA synthetase